MDEPRLRDKNRVKLNFFTVGPEEFRSARLEVYLFGSVRFHEFCAAIMLQRLWFKHGPVPTDAMLKAALTRGPKIV